MTGFARFNKLVAALVFCMVAASASAQSQPAKQGYEPRVGQAGKDVVWVPTPQALVDKMLDIAKATPSVYLIDLGSGDGRTVITAAKRGLRAQGIEYNPDMVELSKRAAAEEGVSDKASFAKADLYESDFSKATVITMFLLPEINLKLRPRILNLKSGTRIVSNTFTMGEWTADETASVGGDDCYNWCTALLWIVPAKVEGTWKLAEGELTLKQTFQTISGTLKSAGATVPVTGKLRGEQISFSGGASEYTGRVTGNSIEGVARSGGRDNKFSATKASGN
jgi:hypothetical protein